MDEKLNNIIISLKTNINTYNSIKRECIKNIDKGGGLMWIMVEADGSKKFSFVGIGEWLDLLENIPYGKESLIAYDKFKQYVLYVSMLLEDESCVGKLLIINY
jgi:hypothetical protein